MDFSVKSVRKFNVQFWAYVRKRNQIWCIFKSI